MPPKASPHQSLRGLEETFRLARELVDDRVSVAGGLRLQQVDDLVALHRVGVQPAGDQEGDPEEREDGEGDEGDAHGAAA